MKLIGIGGTDGSGKDTVADMLVKRHGWVFISLSDLLRDEAKKRGIRLQRNTLRVISAEWRRKQGNDILVQKALQKLGSDKSKVNGLVVASLRNPVEADAVHSVSGKVAWVDADPKVRYVRIQLRQQGTEDEVTFEEFLAEEKEHMTHQGDDATLSLSGVKERADIFLENNGSDIEKFKDEAEKALASIIRA